MRLAGELKAQNERILALEENQKKATTDIPLPKPLTPGKNDLLRPAIWLQSRVSWLQELLKQIHQNDNITKFTNKKGNYFSKEMKQ